MMEITKKMLLKPFDSQEECISLKQLPTVLFDKNIQMCMMELHPIMVHPPLWLASQKEFCQDFFPCKFDAFVTETSVTLLILPYMIEVCTAITQY